MTKRQIMTKKALGYRAAVTLKIVNRRHARAPTLGQSRPRWENIQNSDDVPADFPGRRAFLSPLQYPEPGKHTTIDWHRKEALS